MMVCMGHLYGVVLYYATSTAEQHFRGVEHYRPEVLYFWVCERVDRLIFVRSVI